MSDTNRNKDVVRQFFGLTRTKCEPITLLADDAEIITPIHPDRFPAREPRQIYGRRDRTALLDLFAWTSERFGELQLEEGYLTAEDNRVAVQMDSHGTLKDGSKYNNRYHLLVELDDGKIKRIWEYLDSNHAYDVLLRESPYSSDDQ